MQIKANISSGTVNKLLNGDILTIECNDKYKQKATIRVKIMVPIILLIKSGLIMGVTALVPKDWVEIDKPGETAVTSLAGVVVCFLTAIWALRGVAKCWTTKVVLTPFKTPLTTAIPIS